MSILVKAKEIFEKCGHQDFTKDLSVYIALGYVFITPDTLLIMKPVNRYDKTHPNQQWDVENPNAWYVHAVIGELKKLAKFLPFDLPFIGYERGVKKHYLKWFDLQNFLKGENKYAK